MGVSVLDREAERAPWSSAGGDAWRRYCPCRAPCEEQRDCALCRGEPLVQHTSLGWGSLIAPFSWVEGGGKRLPGPCLVVDQMGGSIRI